jgi:protein tyrosine/serine phosphatase
MPIDRETAPSSPPTLFRWIALTKASAAGVVAGLAFWVLAETGNILVGSNFHEVAPGIYRIAQPTGSQLAYYIRRNGIKTVINLRGCCDPSPWYLDEAGVCAECDVSLEDLGFSAGRMPAVDTIRELVDVLEHSEYPILVHCHRGIDRTGMTVAMALLLRTDCSLEEARYQLGPRYGHLPLGRTGNIDRFFDMYQEYLDQKGIAHSRATFRHWVLNDYCPAECRCTIEVLDPTGKPAHVPVGRPFAVHIRCHNTSVKPWQLRPNTDAGIHAIWQLFDDQGKELRMGRSGLFFATVEPGQSIDLTLSIPSIRKPGRYQLRIDMKDEQHAFFFQLGQDPLIWDMVAE